MAAQLNIGGALCKSSVIPFLVPRHKVWLTAAARVLCNNAANIGERKTWTQKVNIAAGKNSVRGEQPPKCTYGVTAQEMAKDCAKFCWPPVSDVGAVTKPTREIR